MSHTYVLLGRDGLCKIGRSNNPEARCKTINALGLPCELVYKVADDRALAVERRAHTLMKARRVIGEWFDVTPDVALAAILQATSDLDQHGEELFSYLHIAARRSARRTPADRRTLRPRRQS